MRLTLLMSILFAGAAQAQENSAPTGPVSEPKGARVIECFCTDRSGARVELGETICLMVDGRAYLARCEMSLNNPMWRDTGSECVGARAVLSGAGLSQSARPRGAVF